MNSSVVVTAAEDHQGAERYDKLSIAGVAVAFVLFALFKLSTPLQHDVAWLLDAGGRWAAGERLYVDIEDLNPPLVFYLYGALSAGLWTKSAFTVGTLGFTLINALWCARLAGPRWGAATLAIAIVLGVCELGQRDHLAATVLLPYLFADRARAGERMLIGAWCFLGFGLKPYFLLIVAAATLGRMLQQRSWKPALAPENLAIGGLGVVYVGLSYAAYPALFSEMLPLARLLHFNYGASFLQHPSDLIVTALMLVVALTQIRDRDAWPAVGALLGGIACYLIQAHYWTYQLLPAFSAGLFLLTRLTIDNSRAFALSLVLFLVLAGQLWNQHYWSRDPIPGTATTVLIMSSQVSAAYPWVVEHGVENASPYAALSGVAAAVAILDSSRESPERRHAARQFLGDARRKLRLRIAEQCPDPILADARRRKPYFRKRFDFMRFLSPDGELPGYRKVGTAGMYAVYRRSSPCAAGLPQ